ncbi:MAG TPA: hypothetical protein VFM93_04765 [Candidatus Limnocylindria bacterium]|nr:hypothetical protein [Candidatus Limnocylindria bacterium]
MRLLLTLLVALMLLPLSTGAAACSCSAETQVQHAARADAVFVGRLAEVDRLPDALTFSSIDPVTYRFAVERVLKGAVPLNAAVRSVVSGASCGLEGMRVGERYTVFAEAVDGSLRAGLCGGTHPGDAGALDLAGGTLLAPVPDAPTWALAAAALAAALSAFAGSRRSVRA